MISKQNSQEIVKSDKSKTKTSETEKKNCKKYKSKHNKQKESAWQQTESGR